MSDDAVSCFIVDIPDSKALSDVFLTMKYIDTSLGLQSTSELLQYFDAKSWNELPGITLESFSVNNSIASVLPSFELPSDIIGSFDYFDFSSSIFTDGWYRGVGCKSIKVDYSDSSKKALKAELSLLNNGIGQLVYAYPQHENMTHTPYISFDIRVSDSLEDSLYEVEIVLGNSASKLESSCVLKGNEATSIVLDISGYDKANTVENIKISVRSIYGDADTATLWLDGISGHSKDNTSEKLEELIGKDRDAINNSLEEEKTAKTFEKAAIAMGIAIIVGSLAIGLFITFKKNRNEE
jgi:hypothetical protein